MRKRTQRDIESARDQATASTLRVLLPIVDDLERAVAAASTVAEGTGINIYSSDGIKAIAAKAKATLASLDVQAFESVGKPFMAELMDAIAKVPTRALPAGEVAVEITKGYHIKGQLLRPAQVAIAEDE
jgi:molecular chaperone GrpE